MDSALIAELDDVHVLVDAELLSAAAADARSGDHAPSHDNLVMQLAVLQADNRHLVHALAAKEQSQRMLIQYVVTVSVVSWRCCLTRAVYGCIMFRTINDLEARVEELSASCPPKATAADNGDGVDSSDDVHVCIALDDAPFFSVPMSFVPRAVTKCRLRPLPTPTPVPVPMPTPVPTLQSN